MNALGRIPVKINGQTAPTVKNVQATNATPQRTHKFADGGRARSEGQPEFKFNLTCSLLEDKQQILDMIDAAKASGEVNIGFTLGRTGGAREYLLVNCGLESEDFSSDQDGTADLTISGTAEDRLRVR